MNYQVNNNDHIIARIKVILLSGKIISKADVSYLTLNLGEFIRLLRKRFAIDCVMVKPTNGRRRGIYFAPSVVSESKLKSYLKTRKLELL